MGLLDTVWRDLLVLARGLEGGFQPSFACRTAGSGLGQAFKRWFFCTPNDQRWLPILVVPVLDKVPLSQVVAGWVPTRLIRNLNPVQFPLSGLFNAIIRRCRDARLTHRGMELGLV